MAGAERSMSLVPNSGSGILRSMQRTRSYRLRLASPRVRRRGSVCTGTFVLAEAGLLRGRRVTTHWIACRGLAARYPDLIVDPDPIFVRDGNVYTSAGITAGMDLALALVEEDHGR